MEGLTALGKNRTKNSPFVVRGLIAASSGCASTLPKGQQTTIENWSKGRIHVFTDPIFMGGYSHPRVTTKLYLGIAFSRQIGHSS